MKEKQGEPYRRSNAPGIEEQRKKRKKALGSGELQHEKRSSERDEGVGTEKKERKEGKKDLRDRS